MYSYSRGGIYRTCPECGANLDPEERCDCKESKQINYFTSCLITKKLSNKRSFDYERNKNS